jgi:hypothetical protein
MEVIKEEEIKEEAKLVHSPSIEKKMFEHKIKVEDKEYENTWKSGCLTMDKRAVMYFSQLSVIVGIMGFSIYQLVNIPDCQGQQSYMGLLTLLIGLLLPNPKFSGKDK